MTLWLTLAVIATAAMCSLVFATLSFALRDYSRAKLQQFLERRAMGEWFERTNAAVEDLIFVTAFLRLIANILVLIGVLHFLLTLGWPEWARYIGAVAITGVITLIVSVALPHALAQHAGEALIASQVRLLHALRIALRPATTLMHAIDRLVARAVGVTQDKTTAHAKAEQDLQQEILSVVEEGEKEGVVDTQEREMIESVIQFRDTHVGQVMTARPDIIGLPIGATLDEVKRVLEESGHSRLPVYNGTLDQIVGILYARDLLKHLGESPEQFDIRSAIRPAFYVPETKSLRDLLQDFRLQKVHMAIVLDEYGGTSGLVSIEDVLEELVGDISDEHEPHEPAMLRRIDEHTYEADARAPLEEVNHALHLTLPEDAGYETLGGFVSNTLGRIPQPGTRFEHPPDAPVVRFTILEAEPQKVNRVKIELIPQPTADEQPPPPQEQHQAPAAT